MHRLVPVFCVQKGTKGFPWYPNVPQTLTVLVESCLSRRIKLVKRPKGRDTGNDFFVPQIPGGSVSIPGTLNVV